MAAKLSTELITAVADIVTGGGVGRLLRVRASLARDKLFERLVSGSDSIADVVDQDEAVAIVHKYMTCSLMGVANANMDLLADVAAGKLKHRPILSADYPHWADLISGLSGQEIFYLGAIAHAFEGLDVSATGDARKMIETASRNFSGQMADSHAFAGADDFHSTGLALTRTGLLRPMSLVGGVTLYCPSGKLRELVRMARMGRTDAFGGEPS